MHRWVAGTTTPGLRVIVSSCQVLGINPELVADSLTPKYHEEIISLDALQSRYREQFAFDPKIGNQTVTLAAVVAYNRAFELGLMSSLHISPDGVITINPAAPDCAGYRLQIAVQNGSLVVIVETNSDQVLSTEILSDGALKTAVGMIL